MEITLQSFIFAIGLVCIYAAVVLAVMNRKRKDDERDDGGTR